ncbi:MAG: peptidase domain-containing ABC transporter [Bacteroidales bacterium]|nr:peptidase domain-containing ABC transporter [Bacteroidales bacterium]
MRYWTLNKKFHFYRQLDNMDCGPTCLKMIAAHYGKKIAVQRLREDSSITRVGGSFLGLSDAADKIGLRATASMPTFDYFCKNIKLPCIVHWNQNHFVVVYKIKLNRRTGKYTFYIADPGYGLIKFDESSFRKCWCSTMYGDQERGVAMVFTPTPRFYENSSEKKEKNNLRRFLKYVLPYRKMLINLFVSLLAGSIIQLFFPVMTQAIVDYGIGESNLDFIWLILIAQLVLTLSSTSVDLIRRWILLHISTRVNVSLIADFLQKMMKLPMRFFDSKLIGDLIQRISDHSRVESFLTQTMISSLFSMLTIVVFSVVLIVYDVRMFFILLIASVLHTVWVALFMKKRADLDHKNFAVSATYQSDLIEMIEGMQEIKLTGSEEQKRWRWEALQARIYDVKMQSLSLSQWQSVGSVFINQTKNILITILSASAVVNGDLTLGVMLSIQYIIGQMNGPVNQLTSIVQQLQSVRISLERLGEILDKDDEEKSEENYLPVPETNEDIVFDHVDFTYGSPRSRLVLKDLCLTIPAGKTTAIVGLSGSGKTTMIKLMLGFYPPQNGQILLNGRKLSDYSLHEWRANCGTVMQDGFVFTDTIAANIAAGETQIDTVRVQHAARLSCTDEYVEKLPLKYDTVVGKSGVGLSQGQKQRLLIARVIYRNPQYVFLDEATNSLDASNELRIVENLNTFLADKTVVIVAHRLSTVCHADNIVVLSEGSIIEQGAHKTLLERRGAYYNLIKDQLQISQ